MTAHRHDDLAEIAALLAAGLLRLLERKSSQILPREAKTLLDCGPQSEGDVARKSEDIAP